MNTFDMFAALIGLIGLGIAFSNNEETKEKEKEKEKENITIGMPNNSYKLQHNDFSDTSPFGTISSSEEIKKAISTTFK